MVCPSHTYCAFNRPKPSKCRVGFSNVNGQGSRFTRRGYRAYEDKFRLHLRHTLCNLNLHLFQHGQTLSSQVCERGLTYRTCLARGPSSRAPICPTKARPRYRSCVSVTLFSTKQLTHSVFTSRMDGSASCCRDMKKYSVCV